MLCMLPLKRHRILPLKLPVFSLVLRPYSFRSRSSSSSSSSSSSMSHAIHFNTSSNKEKQLEINISDENATGKHEACVTRRPAQRRLLNVGCILKHLGFKNNQQRPNAIAKATNSADSSFSASNNHSSVMDTSTMARTSTSDVSVSCSKEPECPVSSGWSSPKEGTQEENESPLGADYTRILEENSLPTSFGKRGPSQPKKEKSIKRGLKNGGDIRNTDQKNKSHTPVEVFDICQSEADESTISNSSPIEFLDEAKEPEVDELSEEPAQRMLRPGMILLKNFINSSEQVSIVKKCRNLGIGRGGFYRPGYKDGAKLRLHMMCLGLDWDPQTRKYSNKRRIDRSKPPGIPPEFHSLVDRAMDDSYALIQSNLEVSDAKHILPQMNPDVCIVNFYSETGRLGLHQDRDESPESLSKKLPVVSVSLGDSAEFLYGDHRDANKAEKLILESGDILIFGGESRHVFHGVASIIPDSAPHFLLEETRLRPGRLNLTFRQY